MTPIGALINFCNLASRASPDEILPLLTDAAVAHTGASAAAVVRVLEDGRVALVTSNGLPAELADHVFEEDAVGPEIGANLRRAAGPRYRSDHTFLLVNGGDLFGALVLLAETSLDRESEAVHIGVALADLAAIALGQAARYQELARSYEELRASREVLARTHKLRALGEMAAGVSHDLRNLLNPISLHLQLSQRAIAKGDHEQVAESVVKMREIVKRGVQTIDRLRDFSQQSPSGSARVENVDKLATEAVELGRARLSGRLSGGVAIELTLGGPPPVMVHGADLVSALVNFVVNAIDAMPDGGTVSVATGADDEGVWVRVEDDGPGMPPDVERRIFEPFFSTKGERGSGLGLAMVYAFVQRSGGRLQLKTAPGEGAAFTLWFPIAQP